MKRRSMRQQRKAKAHPYATKIKLKTNGHSRSPHWMWWCVNESEKSSAVQPAPTVQAAG